MMNIPNPLNGVKPTQPGLHRNHAPKASVKPCRQEQHISLERIIGTTTSSVNGFDCLPELRLFAYVAGNAAVVARISSDFKISQRFFRARPTTAPIHQVSNVHAPSTPLSTQDSRNRAFPLLKDASPRGSPLGDWAESPTGKTWSARERTKAATCLSLSPSGRFLAVGETGYKPRVLIFSMAEDACSDQPLTALTEHGFGVQCVAFSPDSQFLASLGSLNDGFLHIWQINQRTGSATLHASNRCTSTIRHMAWFGSNLITIGLRHVKIWRVTDETQDPAMRRRLSDGNQGLSASCTRTLAGRNCLLGSLLESTFSLVVPLSPSTAIVCSEKGDICLLDDSEAKLQLRSLGNVGFGVSTAVLDAECRLSFAGFSGELKRYELAELCSTGTSSTCSHILLSWRLPASEKRSTYIVAMGSVDGHFVTIDSQHATKVFNLVSDHNEQLSCSTLHEFAAHRSPILGVRPCHPSGGIDVCFYTWSADGLILFWNSDGLCTRHVMIPLEQPSNVREDESVNELKVVCGFSALACLVSGDRYGVLRVSSVNTQNTVFDAKAHAGEVTDIAVHEHQDTVYVATSGRDRMVQLFEKGISSWDHVQTLDNHIGAVTGVMFSKDGSKLLSYSSDRTIVVTERVSKSVGKGCDVAFRQIRTITLKATPMAMTLHPEQPKLIFVSTLDRQIIKVDFEAGRIGSGFKASDSENGDAVVVSGLVYVPTRRSPSLAAISSTDKSLRLYTENGSLLVRDHGHTEGLSGVAFVNFAASKGDPNVQFLVTVALDGTIFLWTLISNEPRVSDTDSDSQIAGSTVATRPTLLRVRSQSELALFGRSAGEGAPKPLPTSSEKQSPQLHKKKSRFSLAQTPKLATSPLPRPRDTSRSRPTNASPSRRKSLGRSPSPASFANKRSHPLRLRKSSPDVQSMTKTDEPSNESGSLSASTGQLSRMLRAYRRRLAVSPDNFGLITIRELEHELSLTIRALNEKTTKTKGISESTIVKLLDQYSERLVEMLDEKIAASVARQGGIQDAQMEPSSIHGSPATT